MTDGEVELFKSLYEENAKLREELAEAKRTQSDNWDLRSKLNKRQTRVDLLEGLLSKKGREKYLERVAELKSEFKVD